MPIRLMIHGASGRMGQALVRLCGECPDLQLVAAVAGRHAPSIEGVPGFTAAQLDRVPAFDVCIDFSLPDAFDPMLAFCVERGAALVSGTTGLNEAQMARFDTAAAHVPVLWAANFSLGVAILSDLVRRAAQALPQWQRDIVESHHIHKQDAPSGTALALGWAVVEGGGPEPHYASLRAGDIIGEHLVQFTGMGERIELIHRATHRDIFARGALHCATALAGRPAGRYSLMDLLVSA
ncbi:4-hydroxy-tetrahydrodipicolinate reductase [Xanthomonadaceae bacterium XH05]|nr:4-hydroxy-tetrahydrodipicolinate reductase [Xanthomonadaceae bacterium XH05]